ncbi:MAG: sulfatase-like hydrolase/transferase [Rhodocyclaceae bacterium]|nr:sulfatase-like hydrolase/transferase [Rhodocyclaceae bacterium]MDZ4213214.1 sulfatase-like hydrolase/transferase [Rhodocyclaceae bacterium]
MLLLNGLLSFGPWWPTPGIVPQALLAPEFVGLWLLLLWRVARQPEPSRRTLEVLSTVVLCLMLGRYADVTAPSLFGRPVNLYWDLPQLPRFLWVSAQDHPAWLSAAVAAAVMGTGWLLFTLIRFCLSTLMQTLVPWTLRSFPAWLISFGAALLVAAHLGGVEGTGRWVSNAVLPTYAQQIVLLWDANAPNRLAQALPAVTPTEDALATHGRQVFAALAHRDVSFIFLESFGAVLYDHPQARLATDPARQALQDALTASGRQVVSGFFRSPTIGGASDLAHLSLLSGIDLSDARRHNLLLTTRRPTLLHLFKQAGYQTFGLYHAVSWPWPEHIYYGFDHYIDGPALRYQGPPLTFWKIPDQVALASYEQQFPRTVDSLPRVLFFPTISSHFPFSPIPPYQPDWQRVLSATPFDADQLAVVAAQRVNWLDMRPDYLSSVNYVYQWLTGYFGRPEPRETIYVLIGDHQPTANITGERPPWDVPVHIISRDRALLDRFKTQGFSEGLWPERTVLGEIHHLTSLLLSGFGPVPARP